MKHPRGAPQPDRPPSRAALQAAIQLLGDAQPNVHAAARTRLLLWGEAARDALSEAGEAGDAATRLRARAALRVLDVRHLLQRFATLHLERAASRAVAPLLDGATLLSQMVRTFVPEADELRQWLRSEAALLRSRFAGRSGPTRARLLAERLAGELGFRGGDASCLELDHVLLDRVLQTRTGTPVALSLVYLLVARAAGLSVAGVGMPDHFLVRLHGPRPVLLDPFHGGRTVTKTDCVRYLKSLGHGHVREHLRDLSDREVLVHYLRSLRRAACSRSGLEAQQTLGRALQHLEAR
jgi:regulator of sirC expression with transglutaminase-like and TPR domain